MNERVRRRWLGSLAGLLACPLLILTTGADLAPWAAVLVAVALGVSVAELSAPRDGSAIVAFRAAALAVPTWVVLHVALLPLLAGGAPRWDAMALRDALPAFAGDFLALAAIGVVLPWLARAAERWWGPVRVDVVQKAEPARVLILGGGFAGVATAQGLERTFGASAEVELTLVSATNAMLFTPMLAEVAGSSLEASHITNPLRTGLRRTEIVRGQVTGIDLAQRLVTVEGASGRTQLLGYDHVVLALGAVSNYLGLAGVAEHAFDFKSIADAAAIRDHVIECFERADVETDADERRRLLTFVVAGGGFAGVELAGALNDFVRGMLPYYLRVPRDAVQVVLVHGGPRILMELSESLSLYAQRTMAARGVTFRLGTRVKDAMADRVVLSDGELATRTLVWTAGTAPNPLLRTLGLPTDPRGAVVAAATLQVPGHDGVWVVGDAGSLPNAATGKPCPPTAQFAIRQARLLARNLKAALRGDTLRSFAFQPLGALCVVGHHTACAEIRGLRFSGLFAWLLWRGVYLGKLPSLERKLRVVGDWLIELFFPRDIAQVSPGLGRRGGAR